MNEEKEIIWMTPKEVSDYLKMSIDTVYRYLNATENPLPSYKLSRSNIRIAKAELDKWVMDNNNLKEE